MTNRFQSVWRSLIFSSVFFLISLPLQTHTNSDHQRSSNYFAILMYDSDIGFGFGAKGVIKNQFHRNESLDLILFGSTKGEQWYVFTFSIPDRELRQGTLYPVAFDLKLEYDKLLKSNFFGYGNDSEDNDWQFPREFTKIEMTLSHAFTRKIISETGLFFHYTSTYRYQDINPLMTPNICGADTWFTGYWTARLFWDTRDSQIHPQRGWKLGLNVDAALKLLGSETQFTRIQVETCHYQKFFSPAHILAFRLCLQNVQGTAPYYEQSIIGGGWTARGFKADRFIDTALALLSIEYRNRLYKRLGGVLFTDTGRVFSGIENFRFQDWKMNWGAGLRYTLTNFVVRLDIGISSEGERLFFNFGHVF
jgi:outer membrane protein assembly factor BamA